MNHIATPGRRIELVPMDPHWHDITIALYETRDGAGTPAFRAHSYSTRSGVRERLAFVNEVMMALGEMEPAAAGSDLIRFPCGSPHRLACRRLFLEACKLPNGTALAPRPLSVKDSKSGRTIRVVGLGDGAYGLAMADGEPAEPGRLPGVANGLVKLGEMKQAGTDLVAFDCGRPHDGLVGLLLPRALNVRAALREQEAIAGRGILAAPSAQQN